MKSIFDLKTKNSELSSANQGLSNYHYQEITALRSVTGSNFTTGGDIVYRWNYGGNRYWIPNKSYLRVRVKVQNDSTTALEYTKGLTLAMNAVANLFQSSHFRIANQDVCSITQNLAQIDTLKNRMNKSSIWLNSMGNDLNCWDPSFRKRHERLFSPGGNDINGGLNIFMDFAAFRTATTSDTSNDCTVAVTDNADGTYTMAFVAGTNPAPDLTPLLTLSNGPQRGDIIIYDYEYEVVGAGTNYFIAQESRGVIVSISAAGIVFIPDINAKVFAAKTFHESRFNLRFAHGDFFEDRSSKAREFDLIWYPTLPIFDVKHAIPCAGTQQEFTLLPWSDTQWQKNLIESRVNNLVSGTDFYVEVTDMRFYLLTCNSNNIQDNMSFILDMNEIQCQSQPISALDQMHTVDISPSTNAVSIAFQDSAVTADSRYTLTKFHIREELELNLTRYYLRYDNQVPQPDSEISLDLLNNVDDMRDLYNRTKCYDGSMYRESPESLDEWRHRGMYIHHPFPKTASSRNTRLYTHVYFSSLTTTGAVNLLNVNRPNILIFAHNKKAVILKISNGKIVGVSPYDA